MTGHAGLKGETVYLSQNGHLVFNGIFIGGHDLNSSPLTHDVAI